MQKKAESASPEKSETPAPKKKLKAPAKSQVRKLRWGVSLVLLLLVAGAIGLAWKKHAHVKELAAHAQQKDEAGPLVQTEDVKRIPEGRELVLVGESRPYFETTLYAKVSGYLKTIYVDEGSFVKKDQILAEIASPETDQALLSAQADATNKARIAGRYRKLLRRDLVSAQEAEQYFTAAAIAKSTLASAQQAKEYETLRAPFDGVVSSRLVDPGDLVSNSSNSKTAMQAILTVAETKRLKVNAYVDQKFAPSIEAGLPVQLYLSERMDEKFPGVVARVAGTLDRRTRMLPIEVDFDNTDGKIVPGSFVQVQIKVPTPSYLTLPVEALITENGKPAVAKVGDDKKLEFREIEIVDNDGSNLTLMSGVEEGDKIALNLGDSITNGDKVQVKSAAPVAEKKKKEEPVDKSQAAAKEAAEGAQKSDDSPSKADAK